MKTATFTRSLGLGVTAALVATAFPFTAASAAASYTLDIGSEDGSFFQPGDYAAGDITVQVKDAGADADVADDQDLRYVWTFTPFGGSPVLLPATGEDVQATDVAGKFVVPLPVSKGSGEYMLEVQLDDQPVGTTGAPTDVRTFTVGNSAEAGSTATVTGLDGGKPGQVDDANYVTITDASGDPVVDQVFTLKLDRGFFTDGDVSTADGALVGNLRQQGKTLTGITDSTGRLEFAGAGNTFQVGIARDAGFDDDGLATSAVTVAGVPTTGDQAAWDSASPLNGRLAIRLSPAGVQENAVNPTPVFKRTAYDVFALDQFGNPVASNAGSEILVGMEYTNTRDGFDSGDTDVLANLDRFGDIRLYAEIAGTVGVKGTWFEAPTTTYDSNNSNNGQTEDVADVVATTTSTWYQPSFNASRYSLTSSVTDTVRIGTTVTQTVRVRDQRNNPVDGLDVRFLRFAPDERRGEVVTTRTTNALGEATYTFIGTEAGTSTTTAVVTDGLRRRQLTSRVSFGKVVRAKLTKVKGSASGRGADRMTVTTRAIAPGARVYLYKIVKGKEIRVGIRTLNSKGKAVFSIRDRNRGSRTTYVAQVRSTTKTIADRSNKTKLR